MTDATDRERLEGVAAIRAIMDDIDHGIWHNGNDHSGGPLSNCPRCVTNTLLSRLEAAEADARQKERKLAREQARKRLYRDALRSVKEELLPSADEVRGILGPNWKGSDDAGARERALKIASDALGRA